MAYFPFFIDLKNKNGLVVGGGVIALRKIEKIIPYCRRITVCAPRICDEIRAVPGITILEEVFREDFLEERFFVIAATDDKEVNRRISVICQERGILVNSVDDASACSFIFPALVNRGDLSIGISTGGASPTAAILLKNEIEELLPDNCAEILRQLNALRPLVKNYIPDEKDRAVIFKELCQEGFSAGRLPDMSEIVERLENIKNSYEAD